jgi:hypothetical protein
MLQMETLFALSEIDPKHPALTTHRPTVVRVVATIDFASTFVRGELCDYILISRPHYVLLRELAVLLRMLHAGAPPEIRNARPMLPDSWIGDALDELLTRDRERLRGLVEPLQKHAVALYQEELPPDPVLLNDWLAAQMAKADPCALELLVMYSGADHFVLFHELSHALELDPHDGPRNLATELATDRGALSLMIIRIGSSKTRVSLGLPEVPPEDLVIGPTAYLHLLRMLALFHGAWRSAAALADETFAPEDRAVAETRRALAEIDARLAYLIASASAFALEPLVPRIITRVVSGHALSRAAGALLLEQVGQEFELDDLPRFDVSAARASLDGALGPPQASAP